MVMTNLDIIGKFIQHEINTNKASDEYISALRECETLEDLTYEVGYWKSYEVLEGYLSTAHYILISLDK
jgi:hypothetical protein